MYRKLFLMFLLTGLFYGCGDGGGDEDTTLPTVLSTSPADSAIGVAVNSTVKATFSETMDPSFINRTTFTVRTGGAKIAGSVNYGGTSATFIPSADLTAFSGYTATVTTGAKDSNGNSLASDYNWGFVTGASTTSTVSLLSHVQPIFNNNCAIGGCHVSGSNALVLSSGSAYGNLVNKQSTITPGGTLVIPGDSANSILYKRISGISVGAQMPQGSSPLSQSNQTLIKTWIDEGALDN